MAVGNSLDVVKKNSSLSEADAQAMSAQYIRLKYPSVIFHSDFGSGVKLTPYQASMQKRQNGGRRAYPDLFIAQPADGMHGLFLEMKRAGTRLKKKNGTWATVHIAEQAEMLGQLRERGYAAEFAVGFDEARKLIDEYLALA